MISSKNFILILTLLAKGRNTRISTIRIITHASEKVNT
jgi:hypothetical protein